MFALCFSAWNYSREVSPALYIGLLLLTLSGFIFNYIRSAKFHSNIFNLRTSVHKLEFVSLILFAVFSTSALLTSVEIFWVFSFITGIIMMVSVDTVYTSTDNRYIIRYHNGQVFLTGLLLASLFISEPLPFIFISILKTLYLLSFKIFRKQNIYEKIFSIIYIIFLVFVSYELFVSFSDIPFVLVLTILLIFELGMRIIFYFDFSPGKSVFRLSEGSK